MVTPVSRFTELVSTVKKTYHHPSSLTIPSYFIKKQLRLSVKLDGLCEGDAG